MIRIKLAKKNIILERTKSSVFGSQLANFLFSIIKGNNKEHEEPKQQQNIYDVNFIGKSDQTGESVKAPINFKVFIGIDQSGNIIKKVSGSGKFSNEQKKIVVNLEIPKDFLKNRDVFLSSISNTLQNISGHEMLHLFQKQATPDAQQKSLKTQQPFGVNKLFKKEPGSEKATEFKRLTYTREEAEKIKKEDPESLLRFNEFNSIKEIDAYALDIKSRRSRQDISLFDSFMFIFSELKGYIKNKKLLARTKINYLNYFSRKYPEVYKKESESLNSLLNKLQGEADGL